MIGIASSEHFFFTFTASLNPSCFKEQCVLIKKELWTLIFWCEQVFTMLTVQKCLKKKPVFDI